MGLLYNKFSALCHSAAGRVFLPENGETEKLSLIILFIANPVVLYLGWTNCEVFLYAFVVIGSVFYYNREYVRAIFFLQCGSHAKFGHPAVCYYGRNRIDRPKSDRV